MRANSAINLLLIISLISCTKVIDIDLPEHESKLVMNSLFRPGERFSVYLSRSSSFIGGPPPGVNNWDIKLFQDGTLIESATSSDTVFNSFYGPKENSVYSVEISSPGFETITATDSVPSKTLITYIVSTDEVMVDELGTKLKLLKLAFSDSADETNFYEIKLHVRYLYPHWPSDTEELMTVPAHIGGIPVQGFEDAWMNYPYRNGLLFDDKKFNGEECNLEIFTGVMNNDADEYELIVELNSVSEKYYKYKMQLGFYEKSLDSDIFNGVPDPIELYSNVENGYGIFAACVTHKVILNISN